MVGSSYNVAPEVLKQSYGKENDTGMQGLFYIILFCGVPPFWGANIIFDCFILLVM